MGDNKNNKGTVLDMTLEDKIDYVEIMEMESGLEILDLFNEQEVYEIYRRGLYKTFSLDRQFVVYLVLLTNIKANRENIEDMSDIHNSYNVMVYDITVTNNTNILEDGIDRWHEFLRILINKAVNAYRHFKVDDNIRSEVFIGGYFGDDNVMRNSYRRDNARHEYLLIVLLTTLRTYYGFESTEGTEEIRVMVNEMIKSFTEVNNENESYKKESDLKVVNIEEFIEIGQWALYKDAGLGGLAKGYIQFTARDKQDMREELSKYWGDDEDGQ